MGNNRSVAKALIGLDVTKKLIKVMHCDETLKELRMLDGHDKVGVIILGTNYAHCTREKKY